MKVVIDRIEGYYAVCEISEGRWANIPLALVPGAKEGDIVSIEILKDETEREKEELRERLNNLFED